MNEKGILKSFEPLFANSDAGEIEIVNRAMAMVVDSKGNRGKITHFFDDEGVECTATTAVTCVAECGGKWFAIDLRDFENVFSN